MLVFALRGLSTSYYCSELAELRNLTEKEGANNRGNFTPYHGADRIHYDSWKPTFPEFSSWTFISSLLEGQKDLSSYSFFVIYVNRGILVLVKFRAGKPSFSFSGASSVSFQHSLAPYSVHVLKGWFLFFTAQTKS